LFTTFQKDKLFFEMLLFVYGTLKQGFWNDYFMRNCAFIGTYATKEHFCLIISGGCPFVASTPGLYPIQGEVYDVDVESLVEIDALENNGSWYTRRPVEVVNEKGDMLIAELYFKDDAIGEIIEKGFFQQ